MPPNYVCYCVQVVLVSVPAGHAAVPACRRRSVSVGRAHGRSTSSAALVPPALHRPWISWHRKPSRCMPRACDVFQVCAKHLGPKAECLGHELRISSAILCLACVRYVYTHAALAFLLACQVCIIETAPDTHCDAQST